MKLVLKTGEIKEVDTSTIFNNQYNTTDGQRVYDSKVRYIIDDIRLGEFYTSSVKQGTYDEVAQAIAEKRAKINKCEGCFWFNDHKTIRDECTTERIIEGNRETVIEKRVYEISCSYIPRHSDKCVNDIDDTPRLFREVQDCFFCQYPQGVPDMSPLREFMIDNAEKYRIVARWNGDKLSVNTSFKRDKKFGSYEFESCWSSEYFTVENARNNFRFYIDLANKKFIVCDDIGYKVVSCLGTDEYDSTSHKFVYKPIKNYDKFATWLWQIVDDFNASK